MKGRVLKSYKGFDIEKSYELKRDGTIDKETVIYMAYIKGGVFDGDKTLAGLKKKDRQVYEM